MTMTESNGTDLEGSFSAKNDPPSWGSSKSSKEVGLLALVQISKDDVPKLFSGQGG